MITKDLLLITGNEIFYIFNVNQHNLVRKVNAPGSPMIFCTCILNQNNILTGDALDNIKQWRIEGNNLKLISKIENAHDKFVCPIIKLRDGLILFYSTNGNAITIWKYYLRD